MHAQFTHHCPSQSCVIPHDSSGLGAASLPRPALTTHQETARRVWMFQDWQHHQNDQFHKLDKNDAVLLWKVIISGVMASI